MPILTLTLGRKEKLTKDSTSTRCLSAVRRITTMGIFFLIKNPGLKEQNQIQNNTTIDNDKKNTKQNKQKKYYDGQRPLSASKINQNLYSNKI